MDNCQYDQFDTPGQVCNDVGMTKRRGQVGLLLLVVMGLVVGIALSLASRSLSDTVLSRQESESAKAFRLAETGIEQALNQLRQGTVPDTLPLSGDGAFSGNATVGEQDVFGLYVKEGEQAHLDVTNYTGNLDITWTRTADMRENPSSCNEGSGNAPAAIEVIAHRADGTARFAYYNPSGCSLGNNFTDSSAGSNGYRSRVSSYAVGLGVVAVRIRPIYADATIQVSGSGLLTQLYLIQSQAEGGDAKKEIEVKRGLDAPASVFDYALFSGSGIEK